MMFRFSREKIFPVFLERRITVAELARKAGVNSRTVEKAVNGLPICAHLVDPIAKALNIDNTLQFLEPSM